MSTKSSQVPTVEIPPDVNLWYIYNPRFPLIDLISTRRNPFSSTRSPPRPPNSFFLMKNCYMLELRLLGYRLAMPDLCRQAKIIWRDIPQDVKDRYDNLALQAQILHQSMYPNYRFTPKKRTTFKPYVPMRELNNGMGAFPATNVTFLNENPPHPPSPPSFGSAPPTPTNDIYLIQPLQAPDINRGFEHIESQKILNNDVYLTSEVFCSGELQYHLGENLEHFPLYT